MIWQVALLGFVCPVSGAKGGWKRNPMAVAVVGVGEEQWPNTLSVVPPGVRRLADPAQFKPPVLDVVVVVLMTGVVVVVGGPHRAGMPSHSNPGQQNAWAVGV
jgi:hypothetical protein